MSRLNQYEKNQQLIKGYFRSGAVLFRGILEIIYLAAMIGINLIIVGLADKIVRIVADFYNVTITANSSAVYMAVMLVIASIPSLLIAVAYFIIFGTSRSESPSARPNAGFTILNVFAIIELVGAILSAVGGIAVAVVYFIKVKDSMKSQATIALVSTVIACIIKLIMAIIYKLYIGSVSRTAKSVEMDNTGAKAHGVFSVLKAIGASFTVIASVLLLLLHAKFQNAIINFFDEDETIKEIVHLCNDKGTLLYVLIMALSLTVFVIYIVDAKIALGYNRQIKEAEMDFGFDETQPPSSGDGFYGGDAQARPRRERRSGYGDRFIED